MKPNYLMSITLGLAIALPGAALARDNARVVYAETVDPIERTEQSDGSRTARVIFADLDLANAAGEKALERRIRHAASWVCEQSNTPVAMHSGQMDPTFICRTKTFAAFRPEIAAAVARARQGERVAMLQFAVRRQGR
jgi:UrcA family protein